MDWTAVSALTALGIPIAGLASWFVFRTRALLVYEATVVRGEPPADWEIRERHIEALKIEISNKGLRHVDDVRFNITQAGRLWSVKASRATSIDLATIEFFPSDSGLGVSVGHFPARETIELEIFHSGWAIPSSCIAGASGTYRLLSRLHHTIFRMKIGIIFALLLLPLAFFFGVRNG